MKRLIFAAMAALSLAFVAAPAQAANIATVNAQMALDVLVNDFHIVDLDLAGIKKIERHDDGTVTVEYEIEQQAYSITYSSGQNVNRDTNPCYAQYGGFHKPIGNVCVYDPDMYVSKVSERPRITAIAEREDPTCTTITKTRTHTGRNPLTGYGIDTDVETVDGTCSTF